VVYAQVVYIIFVKQNELCIQQFPTPVLALLRRKPLFTYYSDCISLKHKPKCEYYVYVLAIQFKLTTMFGIVRIEGSAAGAGIQPVSEISNFNQ
jgi:hypothetical protein